MNNLPKKVPLLWRKLTLTSEAHHHCALAIVKLDQKRRKKKLNCGHQRATHHNEIFFESSSSSIVCTVVLCSEWVDFAPRPFDFCLVFSLLFRDFFCTFFFLSTFLFTSINLCTSYLLPLNIVHCRTMGEVGAKVLEINFPFFYWSLSVIFTSCECLRRFFYCCFCSCCSLCNGSLFVWFTVYGELWRGPRCTAVVVLHLLNWNKSFTFACNI